MKELNTQLVAVLSGAPSKVDKLATASGVKDKFFMHYVEIFQEAANQYRQDLAGQPRKEQAVRDKLTALRNTMPTNLFNPMLSLHGKFHGN